MEFYTTDLFAVFHVFDPERYRGSASIGGYPLCSSCSVVVERSCRGSDLGKFNASATLSADRGLAVSASGKAISGWYMPGFSYRSKGNCMANAFISTDQKTMAGLVGISVAHS